VNEQIQQELDAEAGSDSQGYFTDRPVKTSLLLQAGPSDGAPSNGPAAYFGLLAESDVTVERLASVTELLDLARSRHR
jgi:hypothetical protein